MWACGQGEGTRCPYVHTPPRKGGPPNALSLFLTQCYALHEIGATPTYSLVAWGLLRLTLLARASPQAPCTVLVPDPVWQALWVWTQRTTVLPAAPPDLATFLAAVGRLGGHLGRTRDGPPGPQTLWRGWTRLLDLTALWLIEQGDSPAELVRPPSV